MGESAKLTDYEISIIKGLLKLKVSSQEILGYINNARGNVKNHINNGRIAEIKRNKKGVGIEAASEQEAKDFMKKYQNSAQQDEIDVLLKSKNGYLVNEESETLEYKESFNGFKNNEQLIKSIQGMANNKGGFIIFGIKEEGESKKRYKIQGINEEQLKKFRVDNKEISNILNSIFGENIEFSKEIKEIANKILCILKINASKNKPIIHSNGAIYYRYNAQNMQIKKIDLMRIIKEQETQNLQLTLYKHIDTILKNGIENSAILNVETGDIEGRGGRLLIAENMLPKIAFIREGKLVEKDGAPAYVIKGEVEVIDSDAIITTRIEKDIDDDLIYNYFLQQIEVGNPKEFLKAIAQSSSEWFPVWYYAKLSKFDKDTLMQFLDDIQMSKRIDNKKEHIISELPSKQNNAKYKNNILQQERLVKIVQKQMSHLVPVCDSIMSCSKEELCLDYILNELKLLKDCSLNTHRNIHSCIKRAIAYIDRIFFS